MKKVLPILVFLISTLSFGQNIVFADSDFKDALINPTSHNIQTFNTSGQYNLIDVNSDNQISISEAASIVSLRLYALDISNLGGLENFSSLKTLALYIPNLLSFDYPSLVNIEDLSINEYSFYAFNPTPPTVLINTININSYVNLKTFGFSTGNLPTINLINNIRLHSLNIYVQNQNFNLGAGNQSVKNIVCGFQTISNLSFNGLPKLLDLRLDDCKINNLDLSNNLLIARLTVSSSNFTTLDLSNNNNLEQLQVNGVVDTLNFGTIKHIRYLSINNTNLTNINLNNFFNLRQFLLTNNELLTNLSTENGIIEEIAIFSGSPLLQTVCCDSNEVPYMQNECNKNVYTATVSSCNSDKTVKTRPLSMYPNPVKDMLHLDTTDKINKVEVFGANGLLIMTTDIGTDLINMQDLQNGIYFLKVYRDNTIDDMKFIKG
jgi:hypothetical protein